MTSLRLPIPAAKPYIPEEDIRGILPLFEDALRRGRLAWGERNDRFEEDFAAHVGATYGVTANSGASALELILRALDIRGKEVIVPTNTNYATAGAVVLSGGEPIFCDMDEATLSPRPDQIEGLITPRTAGVILVHLAGIITPAIEEIQRLASRRGLFLMEDASHAHTSRWNGKPAGSFSIASAFSTFASKVMTTGEGGVITTDSMAIRDLCLSLRNQGKAPGNNDVHHRLGSTYRLTEFQAILGQFQLRRAEEFRQSRDAIVRFYDAALTGLGSVRPFTIPTGVVSSHYKYVLLLREDIDRERLKTDMAERKVILSAPVYKVPCHRQPVFQGLPGSRGRFPEAERFCDHHICLPLYADMTPEEATYVVDSLKACLANHP